LATDEAPRVSVGSTSGKIEVVFRKASGGEAHWPSLGDPVPENGTFGPVSDFRNESFDDFRSWTIESRHPVTHDVDHYVLRPPSDIVSFYVLFKILKFSRAS
jgi:hypothetical protein